MKRIITFFVAIFVAITALSQTSYPDRYISIDGTIGDSIVFYNAEQLFAECGSFMYILQKGKLKPVKDTKMYAEFFGKSKALFVKEKESVKNKAFLTLIDSYGETCSLLIDSKYDYVKHIRSYSFWTDVLTENNNSYNYVRVYTDEDGDPEKEYIPINWKSVSMPEDIDGQVNLLYAYSNEEVAIPANDFYAQRDSSFITSSEMTARIDGYKARKEQERLDSIRDQKPIVAEVKYTYGSIMAFYDSNYKLESDDPQQIYLFEYIKPDRVRGYCRGDIITINMNDIVFLNPDDKDFLIRRSSTGVFDRQIIASAADLDHFNEMVEKMAHETELKLDMIKKTLDFYNKKKVFITSQEYSYGEFDQFGLKFNFYNCFSKEIKYIEIKIVPYNAVNDIARDDFGRSTGEIRCIGPIAKGDIVTYNFDNIFWDEHDIINKLVVSRIKLTFMDGTTTVYSTPAQVDVHRSSNYTAKDIGIE